VSCFAVGYTQRALEYFCAASHTRGPTRTTPESRRFQAASRSRLHWP
jgi:hypothetical protein